MIDARQFLVALLLGLLDPPLDVANRLEILDELDAIAPAERALQVATSSRTESSRLRSCRMRRCLARGSVLPLSPNNRSKIVRGLFSVGSGVLGPSHEIVFV